MLFLRGRQTFAERAFLIEFFYGLWFYGLSVSWFLGFLLTSMRGRIPKDNLPLQSGLNLI